ncbi:acyl-CoA thioesterase [Methylovulum psychrotolerans]|jgi:acyl-CoA hydrolase|uniref:Acyl-CoA thioesterase n=1 Tax=Methylovulum psychrotolerans TaxID=1704499 RepID=A0A1Z4C439_9GAMM|nr:acyl-CoA thioesterase [Methylovulum psychrotolerans]ASF48311.1 acyl-CoA thioesterase [Methylovulum psychrotolerans]MBT9096476.1 acyl-CoA thioesterase [Methylovulum psychrotolerans]
MSKQEKTLTMTVLMTPDMANFSGNVHGGSLLKLLDQVAYACAAKYCKNYVVTAALDQVFFKQHVNVGELVTFCARVNHVGRSSMEVGVKVWAEHLRTYEKRHTTSCFFTMVALDENGKSAEVPRLQLETDEERRLFAAAELRKQLRQESLARSRALQVNDDEDE